MPAAVKTCRSAVRQAKIESPPGNAVSITDGSSCTMMLGEQTDWAVDGSGRRNSCRSSGVGASGWTGAAWTGQTISHGRDVCNNATTITTTIGTRVCTAALQDWQGEYGSNRNNKPLRSPHGDLGTNTLFADGSVRYLQAGGGAGGSSRRTVPDEVPRPSNEWFFGRCQGREKLLRVRPAVS